MNIKTFLTFIVLTVALPLTILGCEVSLQKSELPEQMPDDVEMTYNENGGMSPAYTQIKVSGKLLFVETKTIQDKTPNSWSAEITADDQKKLYQAFVDNKFDTVKNDERKEIVYDAPSSGIYIKAGKLYKNISSGDNSPLSGANAKRWRNVHTAFTELEAKYRDNAKQTNQNYAVIKYDAKKHNSIFKTGKFIELRGADFAKLERLIEKAVNEHNKVIRSENRIKDLSEYKFQYIAVYNDKIETEVYVNAFCNAYDMDWQKQLVEVYDGGSCFFNLKINLTNSEFYDLMVNGSA